MSNDSWQAVVESLKAVAYDTSSMPVYAAGPEGAAARAMGIKFEEKDED